MTYSFDIFDTCFVRACGHPRNIFDILAIRILGDDAEISSLADFAYIRINGERRARRSLDKHEVTIDDIDRGLELLFANDETRAILEK